MSCHYLTVVFRAQTEMVFCDDFFDVNWKLTCSTKIYIWFHIRKT